MSDDTRGKAEYSSMDFGSFDIETKGCSINKSGKDYKELDDSLVVKEFEIEEKGMFSKLGDGMKNLIRSENGIGPKTGSLMAERQKAKDIFTNLKPQGEGLRAPKKVGKPMSIDIGNKRPGAYDQPLLKGRRPNSYDQALKEVNEGIVVTKETAREHFAKRFLSVPMGKIAGKTAEEVNDARIKSSSASDAFRKAAKQESDLTSMDHVVKDRREGKASMDRRAKDLIPMANRVNKLLESDMKGLMKSKVNNLLDRTNKAKRDLNNMMQSPPVSQNTIEQHKYDMAVNNQRIARERAKLIKDRRAQFTRVKEFNGVSGDMINKAFEMEE